MAAAAAAAAARSLAARAGRVAARRLTTTSGAASVAGAKEWCKGIRLADELVQLVEKNPTTEVELVKAREVIKELSQILKAPLSEGMTVQELNYYYMLEGGVLKLRRDGGAADYKPKVNLWEDPKSPMRWKMSHFVVATVTVWGALVYGGFQLFGENKEVTKALEAKAKAKAK